MNNTTGTPKHPTCPPQPVFTTHLVTRFHQGWKTTPDTQPPSDYDHPHQPVATQTPPSDWPWLIGVDLSDQEFAWLTTSGEIQEAAPGVAFGADENPGPVARAAAVKCVAPYTGVIAKITAAWVWGFGPATLPAIYLAGGHRSYRTHNARYIRSVIPAAHRQSLGACEVTTPARTALDLARFDATSAADQAINHLLCHHTNYQEIVELACNHLPQRLPQKALARIRALASLHDPQRTNNSRPHKRSASRPAFARL